MLGREDALSVLRSRYGDGFRGLPTAPVFDMLTGRPGSANSDRLARAMTAIPSVSPAGKIAELLEQAPLKG